MAEKEPEFRGEKSLEKVDPDAGLNKDLEQSEENQTKAEAALALVISGAPYTKVAKIAGYSSAFRARQAVERLLASSADSPLERDKMRILTSRRLNRLLQSVMPKAVDPNGKEHLAYNARALAIIDREAKLWGVDAPTQVQITPTDQHLQEYISKVQVLANADRDAEEMDILEADVVEEN